jgi:hypothetical protein
MLQPPVPTGPGSIGSPGRFMPGWHWIPRLNAYFVDPKLLHCPMTRDQPHKKHQPPFPTFPIPYARAFGSADMPYVPAFYSLPAYPSDVVEGVQGSYALNGWLAGFTDPRLEPERSPRRYMSESQIRRSSMTPVFGDAMHWMAFPMETDHAARDFWFDFEAILAPGDQMGVFTIARHGPGGTATGSLPAPSWEQPWPWYSQMVFYDGHVARAPLKHLWRFDWHSQWNRSE